MAQTRGVDEIEAHRHFSAECFNKAWDLLDKADRTTAEDEEMLRLSQASLWHWTQRDDCTRANLAIGYWQVSRIHAILRRVDEATRYGKLSLECSPPDSPFLIAYAYEALARAESVAGNRSKSAQYRAEAQKLAEAIAEAEEREQVLKDLNSIE